MYGFHDSTLEGIGLEKVRRGIRVQLPTTHYRHHRISIAHFPPQWVHYGLYLPGNPLHRPHADSNELLAHLCDHTELTADNQQSEYPLRCHGRIDIHRIQLQLELERLKFRRPYYDRATLAQEQSSQQSGKCVRHGSSETLQVQG